MRPMPMTPDRPVLDAEFRQRRVINWLSLGFLYAGFYATRYNYTAAAPLLASVFGWKNTELGVFETVMPLVYGLAVVLNGPLADRIGGKKAFLSGAVGVVLMNFLFGMAQFAVAGSRRLGGNRHCPARGHASDIQVRTLRRNAPHLDGRCLGTERLFPILRRALDRQGERAMVSCARARNLRRNLRRPHPAGTSARIPGSASDSLAFSWQYAFWIPGAFVVVLFVINYFFMYNSPKDAGLGEFDTGDPVEDDGSGPSSVAFILRKVFASRVMWMIALGSMMIGFVRRSVVDAWWPKYFVDFYGANQKAFATYLPYIIATWGIALLGIAGGFVFGITSDRSSAGAVRRSSASDSSAWRSSSHCSASRIASTSGPWSPRFVSRCCLSA